MGPLLRQHSKLFISVFIKNRLCAWVSDMESDMYCGMFFFFFFFFLGGGGGLVLCKSISLSISISISLLVSNVTTVSIVSIVFV